MSSEIQLRIETQVHFTNARHGRREIQSGVAPLAVPLGRTPRLARLMALAIRFEELVRSGEVGDYAELARLGHVTRARVTQIMNLLNLAPDLQETLLFLTPTKVGRDAIKEWQVRPIAAMPCWRSQRRMWRKLIAPARTADASV